MEIKEVISELFVSYSEICTTRSKINNSRIEIAEPWLLEDFDLKVSGSTLSIYINDQKIEGRVSGFLLIAYEYWCIVKGKKIGARPSLWMPSLLVARSGGGTNLNMPKSFATYWYPENIEKRISTLLLSAVDFFLNNNQEQEAILCLRKSVVGVEVSLMDYKYPTTKDLPDKYPLQMRIHACLRSEPTTLPKLKRSTNYWFERVMHFIDNTDPIIRAGVASELYSILLERTYDAGKISKKFKKYWIAVQLLSNDSEPYVQEIGLSVANIFSYHMLISGNYEKVIEVTDLTSSKGTDRITQMYFKYCALKKMNRISEAVDLKSNLTMFGHHVDFDENRLNEEQEMVKRFE